jgi:hypothetical protein
MAKGECGDCKEYAILSGGLCRDCRDKKGGNKKKEEARPVFAQQDSHVLNWKGDLQNSLKFMKENKTPAMYISTMTTSSRGYGTLLPQDMRWASVVAEVFLNNFLCKNPFDHVFDGLVIFSSEEMIFTPPGKTVYSKEVPSPSISIISFNLFKEKIENAKWADWVCVLCHEIIHYLHWRWRIIPCLDKELDAYEEAVTGAKELQKCGIPNAIEKETEGKKELLDPPDNFTENGFRAKYGLPARKYYGDCTVFGEQGGPMIDKHPILKNMYPSGQ